MPRPFLAALAALSLAATLGAPASAAAADPTRVAIIVGPVGSLTPTYLHLAELAAAEAERNGASVARAYSPHASPANVLAAVEGAHIVIYFGHGYGHPSPYGGLNTARQNGWALQGPRAHGTHGDALGGELAYYGEDWIVANARPAPGFVMIYSNVCYAPGASEGGHRPASEADALSRVAHYSRKVFRMGGSAYYAVDFDRGAADLVGRLLTGRQATYGNLFGGDHRFVPGALRTYAHPFSDGRQVWLHRTKYTSGPPNYWYAFAGDPSDVPATSWDATAPSARLSTAPGDLPLGAHLTVAFSEPVSGVRAGTVRLVGPNGDAVDADVNVDAAATRVVIAPTAPLELGTRYRLELTAGIGDAAGNPLTPMSWTVATAFDADPIEGSLPLVLHAGTHELLKLGPVGDIVERRDLVLADARGLSIERRARLPGLRGSWLEIGTSDLAGWWVAESSSAYVPGRVGEASLTAGTTITRPAGEYPAYDIGADGLRREGALTLISDEGLPIDRRIVFDGMLLVRVAAPHANAGTWLRIETSVAPPERAAVRRLSLEEPTRHRLELAGGTWTAFRFDDSGRVLERRAISRNETPVLETAAVTDIGGVRFLVLAGGELDGWAVHDGGRHTLHALEDPSDSAD